METIVALRSPKLQEESIYDPLDASLQPAPICNADETSRASN